MSLNQAFQLAAAYRQQAIDQNEQAAMQGPLLAVQALSAGLQAQAQSQQAQFQMQSMVLDTQLRIEETKTKQAMQLMEFDLAQKKLAASEQQAKQAYQLDVLRTGASVRANDLQARSAAFDLQTKDNQLVASTAYAGLLTEFTQDQILTGAAKDKIDALRETNPAAHAMLTETITKTAQAQATQLTALNIELEKAMNAAISDLRGLPPLQRSQAEQRLRTHYTGIMQENANKAAAYTGKVAPNISGPPSVADLFPTTGAVSIDDINNTLGKMLDAYAAAPVEAQKDIWDQITALRKQLPGAAAEAIKPPGPPAGVQDTIKGTVTRDITTRDIQRDVVTAQDRRAEPARAAAGEALGTVQTALDRAYESAVSTGDTTKAAEMQQLAALAKRIDEAARTGRPVTVTRPGTGMMTASGTMGAPAVPVARYGTPNPSEAKAIKAAAEAGDIETLKALFKRLELPL